MDQPNKLQILFWFAVVVCLGSLPLAFAGPNDSISTVGAGAGSGVSTGAVSDARYIIKSGFSSGPQRLDGNLTLTNCTLSILTPTAGTYLHQFGSGTATNTFSFQSSNTGLNHALDMLKFSDSTSTVQGLIGIRNAQGVVGNGLYLTGGLSTAPSVGAGQLQLGAGPDGGWALTQGGANTVTLKCPYGSPAVLSGSGKGGHFNATADMTVGATNMYVWSFATNAPVACTSATPAAGSRWVTYDAGYIYFGASNINGSGTNWVRIAQGAAF